MPQVLWKTRYARRRAGFGVTGRTGTFHAVQWNLAKPGTVCWRRDAAEVDNGIRESLLQAARLSIHVRLTGAAHLTHRRVVDGARLNARWGGDLRR